MSLVSQAGRNGSTRGILRAAGGVSRRCSCITRAFLHVPSMAQPSGPEHHLRLCDAMIWHLVWTAELSGYANWLVRLSATRRILRGQHRHVAGGSRVYLKPPRTGVRSTSSRSFSSSRPSPLRILTYTPRAILRIFRRHRDDRKGADVGSAHGLTMVHRSREASRVPLVLRPCLRLLGSLRSSVQSASRQALERQLVTSTPGVAGTEWLNDP